MEKINLLDIIADEYKNIGILTNTDKLVIPVDIQLNIMKKVWDMAVDKCMENGYVHATDSEEYDLHKSLLDQSLEEVKQLIL